MKRTATTIASMIAVSVFFTGCGDESSVKEQGENFDTAIATQEDARKAAGLIKLMQLDKVAGSVTQAITPQQRHNNLRITYPAPYEKERECAASGSVMTIGEKRDLVTYHATNTFLDCRHLDGFVVNGSQTVDATLHNDRLTASLTDNMITASFGSFTTSISSPMKLYANRDLTIVETILLEDSILYQYEIDENSEAHLSAFSATYNDFNVTLDAPNSTMYLNGKVQIAECGNYDITTVRPITVGADGNYTSGELQINGAQYLYHGNTVSVTVEDGSVYTVPQNVTENLCALEREGGFGESQRFVRDDSAQVVVDVTGETRLMWQDNSAVKTVYKPWLSNANFKAGNFNDTSGDTAATYCTNLNLGGYDDWRLPNSDELLSLRDRFSRPAIDGAFQNVSNANWSVESSNNWEFADYIDFAAFGNISSTRKIFFLNVRCVREDLK